MDESQREKILENLEKTKRIIEKIESKLNLINVIVFGMCFLIMVFGGTIFSINAWSITENYGVWDIFDLVKESKGTELSGRLSSISFYTIALMAVSAACVVLNLIWRTWDDKKHNVIKIVAALAAIVISYILLFVILSLMTDFDLYVDIGWTVWIAAFTTFVVAVMNIAVVVTKKQLAKLDKNL